MNFNEIINRLKEPSTYAGLSALALLLGVSNEEFQTYSLAASGLFATVALFLKEKSS